ncbi:hypothetical protein RSAG8_13991, partial [Rhizoctonia solani AG-8 WAC10335]
MGAGMVGMSMARAGVDTGVGVGKPGLHPRWASRLLTEEESEDEEDE